MKLSDFVIISDVDGTLLTWEGEIPGRNIEALKAFTAEGGRFGIATGRSVELTAEFVERLPVNAPCVVYNGGGLYDFQEKKFLMQKFLPESAKRDLETIRCDMPHISVMVICDNSYYHVTREIPFASFSEARNETYKDAFVWELGSSWYKVLFSVHPDDAAGFDAYLEKKRFEGIRFVHTNATLVEMLPASSTKGYALKKLVELGYFPQDRIAVIGDYYNDVEMVEFAAVGAVTAEAPDDLKAVADIVVGPCKNGAVADLVEYLRSIAE